jgi:hypothetical protein
MNVWCWLNTNSGALQSIVAVMGAVLTVASIIVLFVTYRAVKEQADAARALTKGAEEQTQAAKNAAESTKRQADLASSQLELSTAPLIVAKSGINPKANIQVHQLSNRGQGVAFQVGYWKGPHNLIGAEVFFINPSTLASGDCVDIAEREWEVWTIRYKGIDRQDRWTVVYRDKDKPQEHIVRDGLKEIYLS